MLLTSVPSLHSLRTVFEPGLNARFHDGEQCGLHVALEHRQPLGGLWDGLEASEQLELLTHQTNDLSHLKLVSCATRTAGVIG